MSFAAMAKAGWVGGQDETEVLFVNCHFKCLQSTGHRTTQVVVRGQSPPPKKRQVGLLPHVLVNQTSPCSLAL